MASLESLARFSENPLWLLASDRNCRDGDLFTASFSIRGLCRPGGVPPSPGCAAVSAVGGRRGGGAAAGLLWTRAVHYAQAFSIGLRGSDMVYISNPGTLALPVDGGGLVDRLLRAPARTRLSRRCSGNAAHGWHAGPECRWFHGSRSTLAAVMASCLSVLVAVPVGAIFLPFGRGFIFREIAPAKRARAS